MKLIFLDIDGVLNDWERSWVEIPDYNPEILPKCVQALNKIIRSTEAKCVLSSSWRNLITAGHMSLYGFERMLRSHGANVTLIGHTPVDGHEHRWQEIAAWIRTPPINGRENIESYCILDDDPDAFGGRPGFMTMGGIGLTDKDADAVIKILA